MYRALMTTDPAYAPYPSTAAGRMPDRVPVTTARQMPDRPAAEAAARVADRSAAVTAERGSRAPFASDDFFGFQPALRENLPDPRPLLENLAKSAFEIIEGARDLNQIARWVTDPVYRDLLRRVVLGTRVRRRNNVRVPRPVVTVFSITMFEPRDGAIEGSIMLNTHPRFRAVAIRLEGLDNRWRAAVLGVL